MSFVRVRKHLAAHKFSPFLGRCMVTTSSRAVGNDCPRRKVMRWLRGQQLLVGHSSAFSGLVFSFGWDSNQSAVCQIYKSSLVLLQVHYKLHLYFQGINHNPPPDANSYLLKDAIETGSSFNQVWGRHLEKPWDPLLLLLSLCGAQSWQEGQVDDENLLPTSRSEKWSVLVVVHSPLVISVPKCFFQCSQTMYSHLFRGRL